MSESVSEFQTLLRELFQFACTDLDLRGTSLDTEHLGIQTFEQSKGTFPAFSFSLF